MASEGVEFGLLLHTRHLIAANGTADFTPLWDQAAEAERAGYDHVWLGDSVTVLNRARGDCVTTMAGLAMATRTIGVGTVPLLMSLRNPVLLAHSLATLDVIARGRLHIGVSPGPVAPHIQDQFAACGVPPGEKAGRLSEAIELIRRLWAEERVDFDGRYFQLTKTGILPKPVQGPTIPIWIAAGDNERALRRVARLGDGWVTTEGSLEEFTRQRRRIDAYAREYGRPLADVAPTMHYLTFRLDKDGARARDEGWAWMEDFFGRPRDRLVEYTPIFGTPDECVEILQGFADAGMTCVVARLASDDAASQTELLLREVKPRLRRPS